MAQRRGFTVVELVVVMVIMAILLTLGVAAFNNSMANARDAERQSDIDAIAKGLEARYATGNLLITPPYTSKGSYPSVYEIQHAEGGSPTGFTPINPNTMGVYIDRLLPGTSLATFFPPQSASADITANFKVICSSGCAAAENTTQRNNAINNSPGVYVYEPITATNQICINTACVRYNLYYLPEAAGATIQTKASKHQ